ncbi:MULTISPECIES: nucleoside hydrolase [unclassified Crossiella]|uniref:nucleoside hydrolase n=1 Tax=unclassified Crossiella TaxID=2620835 RepID=UPI001FFFACAF|nr:MULTISPECIES: nucleoside hydrolase [unclassified Crossiella]MCK2236842.1 nucleoside hydrolase [Crossiella sp. S99.2]MCK2250510.1 nucleoside hydrolase [Crossiella sp. S99.1]
MGQHTATPVLPVVIDTDAGGDPDDALALVAAAGLPELALVLTGDELPGGYRARFVRLLLDLLGRPEVPVVAGRDLGNTRLNCVRDLVPGTVPAQSGDVLAAVEAVCAGPVRWVGLGPMSNLADVLTARPGLAERIRLTQMGGALHYRDPSRAEHNIRVDPAAAHTVLARAHRPRLVLSDTTFTPELEIRVASATHRRLADPAAPAWAGLLAAHLAQWFTDFHPGTIQHDALTLSAALELPFVGFTAERVALDGLGRMSRSEQGTPVELSGPADHRAFLDWLHRLLDPASRAEVA